MPARHLTDPRAERIRIILLVEDRVQFQEDLCRGVLGIFRPAKEPAANLQDVAIVRLVDCA
jgi:hypothetical protein